MFEDIPKNVPPTTPAKSTTPPSGPLPAGQPAPVSIHTAPTHPGQPNPLLTEQASVEMFKRTGLSRRQKLILIGITIVVFASLIGGGIWLYVSLDPFATRPNANTANANNANATTNIPLQELDTDKDGVRDIDEKRYASDPNKADTDDDGLNDYLEIFQYKTKPNIADSDGDTYLDGDEVEHGYDPNGPGKLIP